MAETALQMVQRHIEEGAARIEHQRALMDQLRLQGHPDLADDAEVCSGNP